MSNLRESLARESFCRDLSWEIWEFTEMESFTYTEAEYLTGFKKKRKKNPHFTTDFTDEITKNGVMSFPKNCIFATATVSGLIISREKLKCFGMK